MGNFSFSDVKNGVYNLQMRLDSDVVLKSADFTLAQGQELNLPDLKLIADSTKFQFKKIKKGVEEAIEIYNCQIFPNPAYETTVMEYQFSLVNPSYTILKEFGPNKYKKIIAQENFQNGAYVFNTNDSTRIIGVHFLTFKCDSARMIIPFLIKERTK